MPQDIINTVQAGLEAFDGLPAQQPPFGSVPSSAAPGNEVSAASEAPGTGTPSQAPAFGRTPSSAAPGNIVEANQEAPGTGAPLQFPPVGTPTGTAIDQTPGGLFQPGGAPVNITQNNVIGQTFGNGVVLNVQGGVT